MFEVKTMNGSRVIAKIAGIESTAKMRSVTSTATRARRSGVASRRPSRFTTNRSPSSRGVTGKKRWNARTTGFRSGWTSWLRCTSSFRPVRARMPPNT